MRIQQKGGASMSPGHISCYAPSIFNGAMALGLRQNVVFAHYLKNSEYNQIPQSQNADKPMHREEEPHNNQE